MKKLRSTTSKDEYTSIQDILNIQGIKMDVGRKFNFRSKKEYFIYVEESDFERADRILKEQLWQEPDGDDYTNYANEILLKEYLEAVFHDEEKKEQLEEVLNSRGYTNEELQHIIDTEYEKAFIIREFTHNQMFWGGVWVLAGGVIAIIMALRIMFSKRRHPLSLEKYYRYDEKSRKNAQYLLVAGLIAAYFTESIQIKF